MNCYIATNVSLQPFHPLKNMPKFAPTSPDRAQATNWMNLCPRWTKDDNNIDTAPKVFQDTTPKMFQDVVLSIPELVHLIANRLARRDIAALIRVNRTWNSAWVPYLYESLHFYQYKRTNAYPKICKSGDHVKTLSLYYTKWASDVGNSRNFVETEDIKTNSPGSILGFWYAVRTSDYHESMDAQVFKTYLGELRRHCKEDLGFPEVVFVMNTVKSELYQRLQKMNANANMLNTLNKKQLYEIAKRPEYKVPLASEVIAQKSYLYERFDKCDEVWEDLVRLSTQNEERRIIQDRICLDESPASPLEFEATDSETEDEEDKEIAGADEDDYSLQGTKALSTLIGDGY
ncbi:hypothetical protein BC939DRAFT_503875 [Gamsiella multidivaricata]|uniref:uncharacterized protein n=1 Tax=Gamsiella multidivaricata TaxID=101098 RepID=UPI00221F9046|nr:uncharacterized protein BC939DRAFT_503875 [Gamsiella multidivaricata]KAI7822370.1 hypothetical protein BC939DRAFT_503875 [Gamsiella multidivaricata]